MPNADEVTHVQTPRRACYRVLAKSFSSMGAPFNVLHGCRNVLTKNIMPHMEYVDAHDKNK